MRLLDKFGGRKPTIGTLYLTATYLIFVDAEGRKETWVGLTNEIIDFIIWNYFIIIYITQDLLDNQLFISNLI